ncbi:MAG: aminopeptidase [Bacteroidetes bacterium]|nr:aminopeptidase [Bacteroidota bacterium]
MSKKKNRIIALLREFLPILLILFFLIFSNSISYILNQGYHQFLILKKAEPLEVFFADYSVPAATKEKLLLAQQIKQFAIDSLGLKPTKNYSTYCNDSSITTVYMVMASEPHELKAKEWWFPVIGKVPYKGFFDKEKTMQLKKELIRDGYDVHVAMAGGWSTLGWFTDPILPNMIKKSEDALAELLIHEMVHGTIYLKNNDELSESLAEFIGREGATKFLQFYFGKNTKEYQSYMNQKNDEDIFNTFMHKEYKTLESFYTNNKWQTNTTVLNDKKDSIYLSIISKLNETNFEDSLRYKKTGKKIMEDRNGFFISFATYNKYATSLENEFKMKYEKNISKMITAYSKKN